MSELPDLREGDADQQRSLRSHLVRSLRYTAVNTKRHPLRSGVLSQKIPTKLGIEARSSLIRRFAPYIKAQAL